jgi:hypothetical protein
VNIAVQLEPHDGAPPAVTYRWDSDTDILTATLGARPAGPAASGSVELEGRDGSWVILDVVAGRVHGVEIAVWPDVRKSSTLAPPAAASITEARVVMPMPAGAPGPATVEIDTSLSAEADDSERLIHLRVGDRPGARSVRVGRDLLLDIDAGNHIAGLWLLNVPPFPSPDTIT